MKTDRKKFKGKDNEQKLKAINRLIDEWEDKRLPPYFVLLIRNILKN